MTSINRSGAQGDELIYIKATGQSAGNLNLSASKWNTSKSIIKQIRVVTDSTDWDLSLYPNDDFDTSGTLPIFQVAQSADGSYSLPMDFPYTDEDDSNEVHVKFTDNSGSNTADIIINGVKAR